MKKIWAGYDIKNLDVDKFATAISKDKKNVGNELRLILCKGYGKVFKTSQDLDNEFKGWLLEYFEKELDLYRTDFNVDFISFCLLWSLGI